MELLNKDRKLINKKRQTVYTIDEEALNNALTLYELSDHKRKYLMISPYFKPLVKKSNVDNKNINFVDDLETGFFDPTGLDYMM
jgi:hypothetical protein